MSIAPSTLSALQRAGQAVFDAYAALTEDTKTQAARVSESLALNPFALENDTFFNAWKTVARLAQEVQNIEGQMRGLYASAAALGEDAGISVTDMPLLAAPEPVPMSLKGMQVIEGPRAAKTAKAPKVLKSVKAVNGMKGNNAKVFACLSAMLNYRDFMQIMQSRVADAAGIPKGSINLAIRQLIALRVIEEGRKSHYRLI